MFWRRLAAFFGRREQFPEIETVTIYPPRAAFCRSGGEVRTCTSGPQSDSLSRGFHPADTERFAGHPALPDADELAACERMTTAINRSGWGTA